MRCRYNRFSSSTASSLAASSVELSGFVSLLGLASPRRLPPGRRLGALTGFTATAGAGPAPRLGNLLLCRGLLGLVRSFLLSAPLLLGRHPAVRTEVRVALLHTLGLPVLGDEKASDVGGGVAAVIDLLLATSLLIRRRLVQLLHRVQVNLLHVLVLPAPPPELHPSAPTDRVATAAGRVTAGAAPPGGSIHHGQSQQE